ncbi:MAG TPA: FAD-dependent oxidoreductase, partial [Pyrinomonadaceae bacterium]|nr:FAD-dependent oxidoreductase [Pyrinomonadaceae bacterium]
FPECAHEATEFVRAARHAPSDRRLRQLPDTTSANFRAFIDAQLAFLAQCTIDRVEEPHAAAALRVAFGEMWQIDGGPQSLADRLAESFTQSGGRLRLNSAVLRLAYGSDGMPIGVDLLSGERVTATRAIVSNLTAWDTYGKLIGLSRTPSVVSTALKQMTAWGVYQVFLLIDEATVARLPSHRLLFASDVEDASAPVPHLMLTVAADAADSTKRTATLSAFTNVDDWFSFHEDSTWHEEQDQATLERLWTRLHAAAPEIGDDAEVIETATPQTYYDSVRRKMGLIGSPSPAPAEFATCFKNLFMVGDTTASGTGLEGMAAAAELLVNRLTEPRKQY